MMQPPDKDNEFDDLIRAAGDNYQPSGAKPDWDQMNALLDQHLPAGKKPRRRVFFFLLIPLLLLLGGTIYYFNNNSRQVAKTGQQTSAQPEIVSALPQPVNPSQEAAATQPIPQDKTPASRATANAAGLSNPALSPATTTSTGKQTSKIKKAVTTNRPEDDAVAGTPASKREKRRASAIRGKSNASTHATISRAELGEDEQPVNPGSTNGGANDSTSSGKNIASTPLQDRPVDSTTAQHELLKDTLTTTSIVKVDAPALTEQPKAERKKKDSRTGKHPLEFSLLYAPELTTVGFSHIDKPGSNYGLLAGYHLSENTVLQTGFIKSRKNYIADGSDFTLRRPLPAYNKLYKVAGYCMMWEIPLNIKSTILRRRNINWYYTAGISSYFMKSEFYDYYYNTPYGDSSRSASFNTQNNYWFSLAMVGIGVEKKISSTMNVALSPFLKVPFRGMGRGNMKLLSTGVNFSLTYRPYLKK